MEVGSMDNTYEWDICSNRLGKSRFAAAWPYSVRRRSKNSQIVGTRRDVKIGLCSKTLGAQQINHIGISLRFRVCQAFVYHSFCAHSPDQSWLVAVWKWIDFICRLSARDRRLLGLILIEEDLSLLVCENGYRGTRGSTIFSMWYSAGGYCIRRRKYILRAM